MTIIFQHKENFSRLEVKNVKHLYETGVMCDLDVKDKEHKHNNYCG